MTAQLDAVPNADGSSTLFDWLTRMRDERPVWREANGVHHIFRFADVQRVITDPAVFSNDSGRIIPMLRPLTEGHINSMDPPAHGKLRRLASQAFTPRIVARLEDRVRTLTGELLDEVDGDRFDLVDALSYPLPVIVIAELLGIPATDRELFRRWVDKLLAIDGSDSADPNFITKVTEAHQEMDGYLLEHCRARRIRPGEDLISKLVTAQVDGEGLSDVEVMKFASVLFLAGHITTTLLLGNAVQCLDENPGAEHALRADRSLMPQAIEEVLRYRSPFTTVSRVTTTEVEVAGVLIPADSMVTPWVISANHDERRFEHADRFDVHRNPNPHIAFGHGIHFCIGAPLARMEGRIAMDALLDRFTELRVDRDAPIAYHERGMYGARNLPLIARRR